ncbi:MAG: hypothetical protein ACP5MI_07970, partial [Candidatus Kryptoniota bacterium]
GRNWRSVKAYTIFILMSLARTMGMVTASTILWRVHTISYILMVEFCGHPMFAQSGFVAVGIPQYQTA